MAHAEVVEYEKSHNAVTAVPDGYFTQAVAAEKAAVEGSSALAATKGTGASSESNLTAHDSIVSRKERQCVPHPFLRWPVILRYTGDTFIYAT